MAFVATKQPTPVTPDVVAWAVREDGRSADVLAREIKVSGDSLQAWMDGDDLPSRGELTRLADTLRRPRSMFFLPSPPASVALPTSFRHPAGNRQADITAQARMYIRSARRIQRAVSWALRESGDNPIDFRRADVDQPAEAVAGRVRSWLGVEVAEQVTWSSEYAALNNWRRALENRGLLTFQFDIRGEALRGFSAWDEHAPMIAINSHDQTPQARIYTLFHELGHLVTRTDAACLDWVAPRRRAARTLEGWCDDFGAAVLAPKADVEVFARKELGVTREGRKGDITAARRVATRYRISLSAAALRLIELRLAPSTLYGEVIAIIGQRRKSSASGGASEPRPAKRVRQYGRRAAATLIEAAVSGRLSERDAADMLRVDFQELDDIGRALGVNHGAA
jgi:Zn-dependent peptidase ImmA (M78 family)